MPTYEMVVHLSAELGETTPEAAATDVARRLRGAVSPAASMLGLAVWRPWDDTTRILLPTPLPRQLRAFFAGMEGSAARAEAAFRVRVGGIMADDTAPAELPVDRPDIPGGSGATAHAFAPRRPTFCVACGHPVSRGAARCKACVARDRMRGAEGWSVPPERQRSASGGRRRVSLAEVRWIQAHEGAVSVGAMALRLGLCRSTVTGIRTGRHRLCQPGSEPDS